MGCSWGINDAGVIVGHWATRGTRHGLTEIDNGGGGGYTERDGFHLENVTNVVIRGFTVRDFGNTATTATVWGVGNQIYLENADYNTIEHNSLINGDMMGITLVDSGNNLVQNNFAWVTNAALANCGIHIQGPKSANNIIRLNMTWGNKVAGITISGAGPGNRVQDNTNALICAAGLC